MAELRSHREAAEEELSLARSDLGGVDRWTPDEALVAATKAQVHAILAVGHAILAAFTEAREQHRHLVTGQYTSNPIPPAPPRHVVEGTE